MYSDVFLHLSIEWFFKGKCYILPSFELCLRCSKGFGMRMTACTYCHDTYLLKKMLSSTTNMLGVLTVIIATIYGLGWRRQWHPTPVLLPGKSHGRRSLVGCSPWGRKESDTTERLPFHFSLSCIGEGNGNPLQCFCLEIPKDRRAWWVAISGFAQSRTQLKHLSSSSSSMGWVNL